MYSVLYVDDEEKLLEVSKIFLENNKDLTVDTISSAVQAMEKIKTVHYDAIISDYQMPVMNGIEFLKQVRSTFGDIPFILFTGKGREEAVIQAINNGADFYLQKGGEPRAQFAELTYKIKIAIDKKRAEDQLEDSQQRMADIINFLPDATFAIDYMGFVIAWNRAMEDMTGIKTKDILGSGNYSYGLPFYGERRPILIDLVLMENKEIEAKYPFIIRNDDKLISEIFIPTLYNGKGAYLWFTASPLYNGKGDLIGAIESIRDISEFKQAEKTLQESITERKLAAEELKKKHEELFASYEQIAAAGEELRQNYDELNRQREILHETEERYRTVFENTGTAVVLIEENQIISLANEEFLRKSGYTKNEVEGKKRWTEFISAEDLEWMLIHHRLRETDPDAALKHYKFRFVTRSGDIRTMFITIDTIPGTKRNVASLLDITERMKTEEALRESEQRYRNVVEDQTEFICRFLPNGTHIFVNEAYCRYFNKQREDIVGKKFIPLIPEEDHGHVGEHFATLTKENPIATIDHRIIMSDGTIRWQRWSDRAIFDNLGSLIEYQSVGRDITDVKQAEEALKETHEKLNLLSSITRHDILNKITACTGYLTLAKQKPTGSELEHLLNGLRKNIEEIQCQIEFTRLYEDLGIRSPIWQNVDEILSQYRSFEIPVSTSLNGIEIYADPMLPKMFANLMDNTLRHGQRATHISVGSSVSQDGLILIWEDNGTGIPDKEKEIIFERGYGKHSGLGLFFVREMLSITGISIHETGNYGTGARFEISVPKGKFRCMDKTM